MLFQLSMVILAWTRINDSGRHIYCDKECEFVFSWWDLGFVVLIAINLVAFVINQVYWTTSIEATFFGGLTHLLTMFIFFCFALMDRIGGCGGTASKSLESV